MTGEAISAGTGERVEVDPLVEHAARGDRTAFGLVVADRAPRLFRLAFAILRSEADAADATQVTFLQAWQELPRLRDRARFDAWLGRILMNTCRDELRRRSRRSLRELPIVDGDGSAAGSLSSLQAAGDVEAHSGRSDEIRRAFARLSADQRSLLAMHHVDGQPLAEIARTLAIPVGTAKWRLFAARRALERALMEEPA